MLAHDLGLHELSLCSHGSHHAMHIVRMCQESWDRQEFVKRIFGLYVTDPRDWAHNDEDVACV